jgi:hypothetical protein
MSGRLIEGRVWGDSLSAFPKKSECVGVDDHGYVVGKWIRPFDGQ